MTEGEKRDLKVIGWQPGQALPSDLARKVQASKDEFIKSEGLQLAADKVARSGHVLVVPAAVKLEDLPSEKRQELQRSVANAQEQAAQLAALQEQAAQSNGLSPSVRAAMANAGTAMIDSRLMDSDSPLLPPQPKPAVSAVNFKDEMRQMQEEQAFQAEQQAKLQEQLEQAKTPAPEKPKEPEISREDFLAFYTAEFLNVDNVRFMKLYTFMGGRMEMVFRTPRMKQVEAVWTQVKIDQLTGKIGSIDDFWRVVYEYQMVLGLYQVKVGGETKSVGDAVDEILADADQKQYLDEPDGTPLPYLVRTLQDMAPFSSESCWRLVYQTWQKFNTLVKAMEVKLADESFCSAIGI